MRLLLLLSTLVWVALASASVPTHANATVPRWMTLPKTPKLPQPYQEGRVKRPDGTSIWYGKWFAQQDSARGRKRAAAHPPLVFLHGGLGASTWLGHQIEHFKQTRNVVAIDSRGQGRSTFNDTITYDLMTDDVVAVLDHLNERNASFAGWSDGAIIILDMLMRHPSRLERGFAFAANYDIAGTQDVTKSPVFTEYLKRTENIYNRINPSAEYTGLQNSIFDMWAREPNGTKEDFTSIPSADARRVWVVDADHEEAVKITQLYDMSAWLPDAGTIILPAVSHFAFMQDPKFFNQALEDLLQYPL
ncbi:alpha/beta-hydrolase [Tilletiaria anomala UBC 951]|uniref:Alpha/beta-hydrolase n=1 Tax=Tilletiaria anomala (strain ATCC 24038 / CBS 436.72 / UBC 951) TaxID=1037660 RepID=A0A066VUE2_TILAU|nr:alpha/beta-hydrolase [Tilletiaria anomala UBC 951]KDN42419.1 alpha/beta-hydrolase [Tilletiaria anomala UBC 951]